MPWGEDIYEMIERRDSAALRRMAEETRKQETRMFLALLAEMIDRQREENMQFKMTA